MSWIDPIFRSPARPYLRPGLRPGLAVVLAAASLVLAGCASPTPYTPRLQGQQTGYTDLELTPNRYRITFTGNSITPRETVESYLLLRAAEVTRAAGFANFVFDTRNTRARTTYQAVPAFPPDPWGPWGPWGGGPWYGRYNPYWGGGWGFAYQPSVDVVTRTRYQAYAEIVLLTPEQAAREPRAINAAEVLKRLGPDAVLAGVPPRDDRRPPPPPPPPPG